MTAIVQYLNGFLFTREDSLCHMPAPVLVYHTASSRDFLVFGKIMSVDWVFVVPFVLVRLMALHLCIQDLLAVFCACYDWLLKT